MLKALLSSCLVFSVSFCLTGCGSAKEEAPAPEPEPAAKVEEEAKAVSLATDIMPLVTRSCGVCHKREGGHAHATEHGAYFETKEDILGKVGTNIVAGKPDESGLVKVLDQSMPVGDHKIVMPPPKASAPAWSAEEIELFKKWIAEGALDN
jgi:hypothetical protein